MSSVRVVQFDSVVFSYPKKKFFSNIRQDVREGTPHKCATCGKTESLKRCMKCMSILYCSPECQRKGWGQHKKECGEGIRLMMKIIDRRKDPHFFIQFGRYIEVSYICGYYFSLYIKDEKHADYLASCEIKDFLSELKPTPLPDGHEPHLGVFKFYYDGCEHNYFVENIGRLPSYVWETYMIYDAFKKKDGEVSLLPLAVRSYIKDYIYKMLSIVEKGHLVTEERLKMCMSRLH